MAWIWHILYIIYSLEVGVFLLFLPWLGIWDNNYLIYKLPAIRPVVANPFLKGCRARPRDREHPDRNPRGCPVPAKLPLVLSQVDARSTTTSPTARALAGTTLLACIRRQISRGVDIVQIREKDLPDRAVLSLASRIGHAASGTATRVLLNGRADLAVVAGLDGVHLPSTGPDPDDIRGLDRSGAS